MHGSMEVSQDQVVVCVVTCVPDRYILEQTTVCAQDMVSLGAHLPAAPVHGPCVVVLQPQLVLWEKVCAYVLQQLLLHGRRNTLIPILALWRVQVGVEISDQHQCGPLGPLADGRNGII